MGHHHTVDLTFDGRNCGGIVPGVEAEGAAAFDGRNCGGIVLLAAVEAEGAGAPGAGLVGGSFA